jgi:lysophospholipase L1-like esterase
MAPATLISRVAPPPEPESEREREELVHRFSLKLVTVAAVALAVAVVAPAAPVAKNASHSKRSKRLRANVTYLALGDSLAFGTQDAKFKSLLPSPAPAAFTTGYVDVVAASLAKAMKAKVVTTNLGCPGETTDSLLGLGPCPYHPPFALHARYTGSQIDAALDSLSSSRRKPAVITLDIGTNDVLADYNRCVANRAPHFDVGLCILGKAPVTVAHVVANTTTILSRLRSVAPRAPIVLIGLYNPLAARLGASSDIVASQLNAQLATLATAFGAKFADPLPLFNPPGPTEIPTLCALTPVCGPLKDIHPTDAGYQALGTLAFSTAAVGKRQQQRKKS